MCGPRCLFIVCQLLGVTADVEDLARLSGTAGGGTTLAGLYEAVRKKGLHAVGMKIGVDELAALEVPAIAHLWGNHFVVVESASADPDTLKVTSPPAEPRLVSKQDFAKRYSGFALLVAKDETLFPKAEVNGPDLRFDSYNYDFGFIEEGEQVVHTFAYQNKGNEELVLSKADTSCSCTQAFLLEEKRIPPGGKGELAVGFDGAGRQGAQFQVIYVHSNDPISPIVRLQISGVIKPIRVPVSPRSLHFGAAKKRDGAKREFFVGDPGDGSLTVKDVTSDSPFLDVSLTKTTDEQRPGYLVKAILKPGAPIGELKSTIKLSTNHPREPVVEIP
nr:DUF1573 domain-containing protein [Anaerolineae bacterium]